MAPKEPKSYYWLGPGLVKNEGETYVRGSLLPQGLLTERQERRFLRMGRISETPLPAAPPPKPATRGRKRWAFSGAEISGKTLVELNRMIADRAEENGEGVPDVFDTIEEAAAFMMRDV